MIGRESLPTRVARATSVLLALVLLLICAAAYVITAMVIRRGVDSALLAALPASSAGVHEILEHASALEHDDLDNRHVVQVLDSAGRVLDLTGQVKFGPTDLPVSTAVLDAAIRNGQAFVSLVRDDETWQVRTGPDWWQALTPQSGEFRVMYAMAGRPKDRVILELAEPLGSAAEALPGLLLWMLGLAVLGSIICGAIAWRMAGETYRPLQAIIATADAITTQTLSRRIPDEWSDRTLGRLISVLNAMMGRLQSAFEAQSRFVAAAAHELRSPLGAMKADLQVALRRERTPEEYRETLQGVLDETARLGALAENLLILARYDRSMALSLEKDLHVVPVLERAAREANRTTGATVDVEADYGLVVDGDPIALERVMANLARNGAQAGSQRILIQAEESGGGVAILVTDEGAGISPEAVPHLFEPFYRVDPARDGEGTGLGLTIVKTVVEAHGGQLQVESELGKGTRVRVWLPRHQSEGLQPLSN